MGIARGMMKVLVVLAAIALVALAVEDGAEVKEMDDSMDAPAAGNGGDDTHPAYITDQGTSEPQGAYAEGTGYYKRMNNFVGPKYGLPGYKESHNWNDDYDILSPLVFDYRFYRALIHKEPNEAALMSEEDLKTEFSSDVQKKKTPDCPQGNIWFNANTFYTMNKDEQEFTMGGNKCPGVFQMYLTKGLYEGWGLSVHKNAEADSFPTIGSRLFNPQETVYAAGDPEPSAAYYQVQSGRYVPTPVVGGRRDDNTFSPARHMTIVFWLKFGNFDEAPNAELFAYGGKPTDNYFRTGVGCLSTDMLCQECYCYFIFVMQADATEYFHTYQADNFDTLKKAFSQQVGPCAHDAHHCRPRWLHQRCRHWLSQERQRCLWLRSCSGVVRGDHAAQDRRLEPRNSLEACWRLGPGPCRPRRASQLGCENRGCLEPTRAR